jgi:hypothetical protein
MNPIKCNTFQKPILTGIILMLIAMGFRLIDIFVLRLDERLGEIILSKALGFSLVLLFVWTIGKKLSSIGFHGKRLGESLLIGVAITVLPFIIAYTVEWIVMQQMGQEPKFLFSGRCHWRLVVYLVVGVWQLHQFIHGRRTFSRCFVKPKPYPAFIWEVKLAASPRLVAIGLITVLGKTNLSRRERVRAS